MILTDSLLTRADAAAILKSSLRFVDKLIAEGKLPVKRIGRRKVLIRAADLEKLIA
jgi:excisionase family DNA binding protein